MSSPGGMQRDDLLTVAAIAAFSSVLETAFHEHVGHSAACVILGGKLQKMGAYYVECQPSSLSATRQPFVGLAGPLISIVFGGVGYAVFRSLRARSASFTWLQFFWWHFFTVSFMTGFGYGLFSAFTGAGDLGTGELDVLERSANPGLWRVVMGVVGALAYVALLKVSTAQFGRMIGGGGDDQVKRAQRMSLTAYIAGAVVAVLVGLLNPEGIAIVLGSAVASSLGGASGLGWMMLQFLDRKQAETSSPAAPLHRNVKWIGASIAFVVVYAAVFGRTLVFE
jgi:hypothetical protein